MKQDVDLYLSRLHARIGSTPPEKYFKTSGSPFIETPQGRMLRPSLSQ